jgi:Cu/Zn superoxide dismutase
MNTACAPKNTLPPSCKRGGGESISLFPYALNENMIHLKKGMACLQAVLHASSSNNVVAIAQFATDAKVGNHTQLWFRWKSEPVVRGLHIHDEPVPKDRNCTNTGVHFDFHPRKNHGSFDSAERHAGDLGNTVMDPLLRRRISTNFSSILENQHRLSVVMHERVDDLGLTDHPDSKTTGNAGGRVACANFEPSICFHMLPNGT